MKCALISLGLSTDAIGIRILSSLIRQAGMETQLIFLPSLDDLKRRVHGRHTVYSREIVLQLQEIMKDADLIGLSVMTHHYSTAKALTEQLKTALDTPIIWGGIHPTTEPEKCLETADLVCVGEGENSVITLLQQMEKGQDHTSIQGIWSTKNGKLLNNGAGPLIKDLNSLPLVDYSFEDHYLLSGNSVVPLTQDNWKKHISHFFPPFCGCDGIAYQVLSARGCPYRCTFCGEVPLEDDSMYGHSYFRKRSIDDLIAELTWAKNSFPFVAEICFCDDTFPSRSLSEIQEFTEKYKEKIALPFYLLVSPGNVIRDKFDLLVDAGLRHLGMGVQSGSSRILQLYGRNKSNGLDAIYRATKIINSYKNLMPFYDIIVENPYESREDTLETLKLLVKLPRPMKVRVYSLSFFPGTSLTKKAMEDEILVEQQHDKTFGQRTQGGYINTLIDCTKHGVPKFILQILISRVFLFLFNRPSMDRFFLQLHKIMKLILLKTHITDKGLS